MDIFTKWIVLITLLIIYGVTLFWDAFKREEPYGNAAYITALIPANFFWWAIMEPESGIPAGAGNPINALGAAAFLVTLWFIAMLRDIFTTRKQKDLDDVFLALIVAVVIQLILYAVLPSPSVLGSVLNDSTLGATGEFWGWWTMPNILWYVDNSPAVLTWFRLIATALILCVIIPMIMDLKGTKIKPFALIIITAIFALPFAFLSYIWIPLVTGEWIAILILLLVLLFILLLSIAKEPKPVAMKPKSK